MTDSWMKITDPDVREVFRKGAESGKLEFLYATTPGTVKYYVFIAHDENGDAHDHKMTKTQLVGAYGS